MSMKMKIISTLALTAAFSFVSSNAVAAEAIGPGAPAPAVHSRVMNTSAQMGTLSPQQEQYNFLNNEGGVVVDQNTGMGILGDRIRVTGTINVGAFAQQNRAYLIYGPTADNGNNKSNQNAINYSGRLFFLADANNWIHATLGLFYAGTKDPIGLSGNAFTSSRYYGSGYTYYKGEGRVGALADGRAVDLAEDDLQVDQAYVDIRDFSRAPVAVRIGRAYVPFGSYDLNAAVPTFTQQLATTRADLIEVAYSGRMGLYGAAYAFNGLNKRSKSGALRERSAEHYINPLSNADDDIENGGFKVGYHGHVSNYGNFHYNVSGGYIFNLLDSNAFYRYLQDFGYTDRVGGWNVHGDILFGAFGLTANYTSAAEDIEVNDLVRISNSQVRHAKPAAGNIFGTFHFVTYGHRSAVKVGYEWSSESALFNNTEGVGRGELLGDNYQAFVLPDERYEIQYNVDVLPNTTVGLGMYYDDAYSRSDGETGDHSTTEWIRLTVAM